MSKFSHPQLNRVTAQDFYDYDKCPHRVYLNHFGNPEDRLPESDFLNLLFERALLHERELSKDPPSQMPEGKTLEKRAASTIRLMQAGVERIYQGVLLQIEDSGIPDLLEKIDGQSRFGSYMYKPVDIKSGTGYEGEEAGELREAYGLQLYHYATLLEQIQGAFPPYAEILNKRGDRVGYPLSQFAELYANRLPDVRSLVTGRKTDEPALCSSCGQCQWWGRCEKVLVATKDVSLLPGLGRSRKLTLNGAGIKSVEDLLTFDFSSVKLKGIGTKTVESMLRAAQSFVSGKVEILNKPALPDADMKLYIDFEDDPTQELIYLCGLWVEPALKGLNYHGLFCTEETGEAKVWAGFQEVCKAIESETYVAFHYSSYERAKISVLEQKYGVIDKDALELFKGRMVDLFPIVKSALVLPARGYGLKYVAPFAGHTYTAKDAGGAQSIVWFQEYQKNPNSLEVLEKLLTYNREDCLAVKAVYAWLKTL